MSAPLAHRIRPDSLEDFVGQDEIVGEETPLRRFINQGVLPASIIFWGPPGTGKTTLAKIIAEETDAEFVELSAVDAGKDDLKSAVNKQRLTQSQIVLFLDEIHRFNKAQQDFLLPYVEDGTLTLIGATTENPSFEVNSALLSRSHVYTLEPLGREELEVIAARAIDELDISLTDDGLDHALRVADGDARTLLNALETASHVTDVVDEEAVEAATQEQALRYDKHGEEHFNLISALHKSIRDSDVQAAVYWTVRMLHGGEDPLYIARRIVRAASEDIGNADPQALDVALNAKEAVEFVGLPECKAALVQAAAYLAGAPKSNAAYEAVKKAESVIEETGALPVPKVIRNAPTEFMQEQGYGEGYAYAHDDPEAAEEQQHLPEELEDTELYETTE